MPPVVWLWLGSPFVLIAVISREPRLQALIATYYARFLAAGWTGVLMMFIGAALIPALIGTLMFTLGTPLVGLVVFLRRDDGDGGGEHEPDQPPLDWDEFERAFRAHARGARRSPAGPRSPSAC